MFEYEDVRRKVYGEPGSEYEGATFIPACPTCGRFVKPDPVIRFQAGTVAEGPNGTCKKHGRVAMLFAGFL